MARPKKERHVAADGAGPARRLLKERPARREGRPDIREIARRAGVSVATVSRVTNHATTVDPKLAKKVWEVVKESNYLANRQARALVSGRSRIFGLLISNITNPFFPELIQSFEDLAIDHGYEVLIGSTNRDPERVKLCIHRMLQYNVEGAAVMTFGIETPLEELSDRNIPLVFIDDGPDNARTTVLKVDYQSGIDQAVQHLAALGHRDIGFLGGPQEIYSAQRRKAAFDAALWKIGIQPIPQWMVKGDHTLEGGIAAIETLLQGPSRPTAVVCSNDMTAIGALQTLKRHRISVPEEMSVVGFDDIHLAEFASTPLTTIRMSCAALARAAFDALCNHVEHPRKAHDRVRRIETQLVVRQSTSYPQGALDGLSPAKPSVVVSGESSFVRRK